MEVLPLISSSFKQLRVVSRVINRFSLGVRLYKDDWKPPVKGQGASSVADWMVISGHAESVSLFMRTPCQGSSTSCPGRQLTVKERQTRCLVCGQCMLTVECLSVWLWSVHADCWMSLCLAVRWSCFGVGLLANISLLCFTVFSFSQGHSLRAWLFAKDRERRAVLSLVDSACRVLNVFWLGCEKVVFNLRVPHFVQKSMPCGWVSGNSQGRFFQRICLWFKRGWLSVYS